jgi:DNA-binding CsgD family transcriptional regulator
LGFSLGLPREYPPLAGVVKGVMDLGEQLSALIGSIYDAALDPTLWTSVLRKMTDFVGGQASGLPSRDCASKFGNGHYYVGLDSHQMPRYSETYFSFDPMATLPRFDVEEIVSTPDLVPYDEFREGRFHQECAKPQGFVDAAGAVLEKSVTSRAYLSVNRNESQGVVDDEMRRRMALIIPHVRRAVLIGKVIELRQTEAATFADITDSLSAGIFLVDAGARVLHANTAGKVILREGDLLRVSGGRLAAADTTTDQALRESFASAGRGDNALGIMGIAMPLIASDGECYVGHVSPLTTGKRRSAGARYDAVAALFVRKAALEMPSSPEIIAKAYKLTPTELRVLLAIVEVGGVPEVAATLGIGATTVKTHLGRIFGKTGTNRQADLVKLVAGFASPVTS